MKKIIVLLVLLFLVSISNNAALGDNTSQSSQVEEILTNLKSHPNKGAKDFCTLVKSKEVWRKINENDKNRLKDAFSNYIVEKNKIILEPRQIVECGEERPDPFVNTDCIVEELQDPRFIPILLEGQSKGIWLAEVLGKYGEDVILPLAKKFWNTKDSKVRGRLLAVLQHTLEYIKGSLMVETQKEIKSILLVSLKDTSPFGSLPAIVIIRLSVPLLSDYQEYIPILQKIAKENPHPPCRTEAKKTLEKLKAEGMIKE